MIKDILSDRLKEYAPANAIDQENALAEIMQHYVLASLARARFFGRAIFHGGTCLRILFGLHRFSEDLDFVLKEADPAFDWKSCADRIRHDCAAEGIQLDVQGRARKETAVRKVFLKTDSIGQILNLELPYARHATRKIRIKLEIDTNPPAGATFETRFITFPMPTAITCMDLPSGFGSKCHALLCREYVKGRDWYDFLWYASRKVTPNLDLLSHALAQQGPWAGQQVVVTTAWFLKTLRSRIMEIDWRVAAQDVARFIMTREQEGLRVWSAPLFLQHLEDLAGKMSDPRG